MTNPVPDWLAGSVACQSEATFGDLAKQLVSILTFNVLSERAIKIIQYTRMKRRMIFWWNLLLLEDLCATKSPPANDMSDNWIIVICFKYKICSILGIFMCNINYSSNHDRPFQHNACFHHYSPRGPVSAITPQRCSYEWLSCGNHSANLIDCRLLKQSSWCQKRREPR